MTRRTTCGALKYLAALTLLANVPRLHAQVAEVRWNVPTGDYAVSANWDPSNTAPPESRFGEGATIANGGVANVLGFVPSAFDGMEATPGQLAVSSGTLNITSTGQLRVVPGAGPTGAASVTGTGVLQIASGGVLESESLQLGGFFRPTITGSGFTPIDVATAATLGGMLEVSFDGFTPPATGSWSLIQAASVAGSFDNITATGVELVPGQFLGIRTAPVGPGRVSAELFFDQVLTLEVNRQSGAVSLSSPTNTAIEADGYRIRSASGSLDSADGVWNSLNEQVGAGWRESNVSPNQIAELKQSGGTQISNAGFTLGNIYSPPAPLAFRVNAPGTEDLVFDYKTPDGSERQGVINYVGASANDLRLTVDPTDGRVRLSNPSGFNVAIEAYSISSASGALNTAGWTSLDDADGAGNNDGGWRESNPSDDFLGELLQTGQQAVANGTQFQLGAIYDFASEAEDLVFEFLLAGESDGLVGTVVYEELPDAGVQPGDFDQDDAVDGADLLLWQRSLGGNASALNGNGSGGATVTGADLQVWKTNFGAVYPGAISAAGAVPEPSAAAIFALAISIYVGLGRRSGGSS